jgi:AraC family transcriptional regulator, transcriptional activator of the genes for pyochelin and ferripyochelin receptors
MGFELTNSGTRAPIIHDARTVANFNSAAFKNESNVLSFPFGKMQREEWLFDGIRMSYSEIRLNEAFEMDWKGDLETITMYFNLKGGITLGANGMQSTFALKSNEHNMFYGSEAEGKIKFEELVNRSFMIQMTTAAFLRITSDSNDQMKFFSDAVLQKKPVALSQQNLNIDLNIQNGINAVLKNHLYSDGLRKLFLLSKAIEILVAQAEVFFKMNFKRAKHARTEYDRERIIFAKEYLTEHMDRPPTLTELARIAGINEYKLKYGFKEIFGNTVFNYLSELRLGLARMHVEDHSKTIAQVADELGYSSIQHFSKAFKQKFGSPPTYFRRQSGQ